MATKLNLALTAEEWRLRSRVARTYHTPVGIGEPTECYLCGSRLTRETAHLDHVLPISRGGGNSSANRQWACKPCNSLKGSMLLDEFISLVRRIAAHCDGGL